MSLQGMRIATSSPSSARTTRSPSHGQEHGRGIEDAGEADRSGAAYTPGRPGAAPSRGEGEEEGTGQPGRPATRSGPARTEDAAPASREARPRVRLEAATGVHGPDLPRRRQASGPGRAHHGR